MKGLVFDIKRFALHDGPGIRTTVFLKGCPLRCWWCHNPESQCVNSEADVKRIMLDGFQHEKKEELGKQMSVAEVVEVVNKDAVFYDESGGGITLSGGEPLLQADFTLGILKACHERGYHTALDTCGYAKAEILKAATSFVDLFLYDLKHAVNELHKKFTGVDNTLILENLKLLVELKQNIIIRIPIIPGINDSSKDAAEFIKIIKEVGGIKEVHLLPYHATAASKYKRLSKENKLSGLKNMDKNDLRPIAEIFERSGFTVKIGG